MAEYCAAIATALESVVAIKKYVLTPIVRQFKYLCCYNSYTERLKSQVEELNRKRDDLQLQVDAEERKGQTIGHEVQNWLTKVEEINAKNERICRATGEVQQGWCPNVKQRYCLSREANEAHEAVVQLIEKAVGKNWIIAHTPPLAPMPPASDTKFDSRKSKEEEIMNALKDNSVHMIGVCGMGGIGKTTMAKIIEKRAREEKIFEEVIMAVASQQPNLKNVQQHIAERLGLTLKEESVPNRAERLHARLKSAKSILIILDDVWEKMNLNELGIPSPSMHEGCKIILTSRVQRVCKQMDPNAKIVTLDFLSEVEAWNLFREKAGDSVESDDLHEIAKKVAKECRGLPLALVTLGSALRDESRYSWEDAFTQLQRSKIPINIPEYLKDVYVPLKWSYDNLQSREVRYLFLLCCLFPEDYDIPIEHLVGYSLHSFTDVQNLRETRNRVYACIDNLKNCFLLINGDDEDNESVKMHDVIRDMAMYIASKGEHVFLVSHGLNKWPQRNLHENYTCISLEFNEIVALPEKIDCPKLEILRMTNLDVIPKFFFDGTKGLKVLDIEGSALSGLSSLGVLTNLRTLYLHECELDKPSIIGQLVNLEILSLKESVIEVMPVEFGGLEKLRLLDVTDCRRLTEIEAGAILGLVQLEELLMRGCSVFKSKNEEEGDSSVHQYLSEVVSLSNLVHLEISISNIKDIPRDLPHWRKLTNYVVEIGWFILRSGKYQKIVTFASKKVIDLPEWIYGMSRDAQFLLLNGEGSSDVIRNVGPMGFQNVKELCAFRCKSVEYLVDAASHGSSTSVVFPVIESLSLYRCANLKEIYHGRPLPAGSFGALREVTIHGCDRLQYVFPLSAAEGLSQLQKLIIGNCRVMEEVFKEEGGEGLIRSIKFPKLQELELSKLPSLNGFCNGNIDGIQFPSLLQLTIIALPKLTNFWFKQSGQFLFNQQVAFTSLKKLALRGLHVVTELFDPEIHSGYMSSLKHLDVDSCPGLRTIFFPLMIRGLTNLTKLNVKGCPMLQELIAEEAREGQTNIKEIFFPQLKKLELSELPKILSFCRLNDCGVECPSLEEIRIKDCPVMETFYLGPSSKRTFEPDIGSVAKPIIAIRPFFSKEVAFTNLRMLKLEGLTAPTELFDPQIPNGYMSGLEYLKVKSCPSLKCIFSSPMFRGLINLEGLEIEDCCMLQEVIPKEAKEVETNTREIIFPQLWSMSFSQLPKFSRFCHIKNDLGLPSLGALEISGCPMLERFSLGSIILPSIDNKLSDLANKFLFAKEKREEIQMEKN